ncbi:MAG: hypothetical protein JO266_06425 [Acidobacteria bacterium]|nr:hypothetical protein [Acidobacteriota bacterium]
MTLNETDVAGNRGRRPACCELNGDALELVARDPTSAKVVAKAFPGSVLSHAGPCPGSRSLFEAGVLKHAPNAAASLLSMDGAFKRGALWDSKP